MANISIYDPRTMGKLVERMPKVQTFIKSTFFRNVETFDTQKIDVDFKKGNRQLAPFVHKKIGGVTIDNEGYETNTYEPPLVAPNKITTVDDILKRTPGESLYGGKSPNQRAVEKMQRDFTELDEMITRREEWMCCQALFTGKIPILSKGDIVTFTGGGVYISSTAEYAAKEKDVVSTCKVTAVNEKGTHKYHCISQDGKGVYGWVNAESIKELSSKAHSDPASVSKGDIVTFTGGGVYKSSTAEYASVQKNVTSTCKVTAVNTKGTHPYHCISQDGKGVYGWVNAADVK